MYVVKLAWSTMRRNGTPGSIVMTTSATAYAPEQSLLVFASTRSGTSEHAYIFYTWLKINTMQLVGLVRALRSRLPADNITINDVAPATSLTHLLPKNLAAPIMAMGLPISNADHVGRALVYATTASQPRRVAVYGKECAGEQYTPGELYNGRVILTIGNTYTELEEPMSDLRPWWFGRKNERWTGLQQAATEFRT